jgi:hypothetical protein
MVAGTEALRVMDQWSSGQFQNLFYWPGAPVMLDVGRGIYAMCGVNGISSGFGVMFKQALEWRDVWAGCGDCVLPPRSFNGNSVTAANSVIDVGPYKEGSIVINVGGRVQLMRGAPNVEISGYTLPFRSSVSPPAFIYDSARDTVFVFGGANEDMVFANGEWTGTTFPNIAGGSMGMSVRGVAIDQETGFLRLLFGGTFGNTPVLALWNPDSGEIVEQFAVTGLTLANVMGRMYDFPAQGRVLYTNTHGMYWIPYRSTLQANPLPLSDVVASLSRRAGYSDSDIDVSALTDLVIGYSVTRPGATRSALEQLMTAYAFDGVQSEGKIKFVRRGQPPQRTIDAADLGWRESGTEHRHPVSISRADEQDLPRVVAVRYPNLGADHQPGVQEARRATGDSTTEVQFELPVVLTDAQAKAIADASLYSMWTARARVTGAYSTEHADLEPTDVLALAGSVVRLTKVQRLGRVVEFEAELDSGAQLVYGGPAPSTGGPQAVGGGAVTALPATTAHFLDVPLLSDADEGAGYYLAVTPSAQPWRGASVYRSTDGGGSYASMASFTLAATRGFAVNALADWSQNTVDEFHSLRVSLTSGSLASVTEAAMLNGSNIALVGGELLQFRRAAQQSDGSWLLTGLLRGRKGTPTWGHVAGEAFTLLSSTAVQRVAGTLGEIGLSRAYKAVTTGATVNSAAAQFFANTAQGLLPLSPVHVHAGRDADGDIIIAWVRRTRIDGQWRDGVDAGLGETAEQYRVRIYSTIAFGLVVREVTASSPTYTYTAAQQVADFGATQETIYIAVAQISSAVGPGAETQRIIDV